MDADNAEKVLRETFGEFIPQENLEEIINLVNEVYKTGFNDGINSNNDMRDTMIEEEPWEFFDEAMHILNRCKNHKR